MSCKKDKSSDGKLLDEELETLKNWHGKNFDQKSMLFSNMTPNWSHVYTNELNDQTVYEIDLTSSNNTFITNEVLNKSDKLNHQMQSKIRLLLFKDTKSGKITDGYYMASVSDNTFHYKQMETFTGSIYFYNKIGNFTNGWVYDNGKVLMTINQGTASEYKESINAGLNRNIIMNNLANGKSRIAAQQFCYTGQIPIYGQACIGAGDGPPVCSSYIVGYNYTRFCVDVQIPTDGSGGVIPDPNNGGQPPKKPLPEYVDNPEGDIEDEFQDYPCARALVEKMKTLKGDIANLVNNTFGEGAVNVNFFPAPSLVGTQIDGRANSWSPNQFKIAINPDVLTKSTQEYILVTLYHEVLHSYFSQKLTDLGLEEFNRQFLGVEVNNGRIIGVVDDQHIPMGYNKFIIGLRDVIIAFNPTFDSTRAMAMAKAGIILSSDSEKLINQQERDTTNPGATGTKCPK